MPFLSFLKTRRWYSMNLWVSIILQSFLAQRRSLGTGVIKGSEKALTCPEHFLDQKSYDSLSYRSQSTFASHRKTVYAIFQSYLKRKCNRGDYDAADR